MKAYVATRPVDFCKGIDGLALAVHGMFALDPFCGAVFVSSGIGRRPPFGPTFRKWASISAINCAQGTTASISVRNISRRVPFFLIASRRPGMAGCLGIGRLLSKPPKSYQITQKWGGSSDVRLCMLRRSLSSVQLSS